MGTRFVIQEEASGCGIVCAAVLAGVSYARAKEVAASLGISASDQALWSDTRHVRRLLRELGIATGTTETPFTSWQQLPDQALLATKWRLEKGAPCWHWVVFVRNRNQARVLDPKKGLKSNVRKDFGRIKPKWFIAVTAS